MKMGACCCIVVASVIIQTGKTAEERNNQGLTAVPSDLDNTETIKLMNNSISDVGIRLFPDNVKKLYLQRNLLTEISPDAFCNTQLEKIYLDYNFITSFPDFTCKNDSTSLQLISVTHNRLGGGYMESTALSRHTHLRIVRLGHNNFTSFNKDLFCNFPLETLNIQANLLTEFPHLGCTSGNFLRLVLLQNPICSITKDDIGNFTALQTLNLNGLCLPDLDTVLSGTVKPVFKTT